MVISYGEHTSKRNKLWPNCLVQRSFRIYILSWPKPMMMAHQMTTNEWEFDDRFAVFKWCQLLWRLRRIHSLDYSFRWTNEMQKKMKTTTTKNHLVLNVWLSISSLSVTSQSPASSHQIKVYRIKVMALFEFIFTFKRHCPDAKLSHEAAGYSSASPLCRAMYLSLSLPRSLSLTLWIFVLSMFVLTFATFLVMISHLI